MDRYVIREPRNATDYPPGNQILSFSGNVGGNAISDNVYYGPYTINDYPVGQGIPRPGFIGPQIINPPQAFSSPAINHGIDHRQMSGIDPRYLANYADSGAHFIVSGHTVQSERGPIPAYGTEYKYRNVTGQERYQLHEVIGGPKPSAGSEMTRQQLKFKQIDDQKAKDLKMMKRENQQEIRQNIPAKQATEINSPKEEPQKKIMSRSDKLQALYKSGPRAFSGPVEKVLKWHKSLQDIGILVFYEIVAKCVSIRPGEYNAKNLVIRDDNGPAMQIVYYETDFLLPELNPPCTVRVIGKMMPGACRLHAFNIRLATGDDIATLSRRAAVAAHHIAKLCKENAIA
ncbi:uncharacterized protein LOC110384868 [Bombyx mori]|uniref:Uncharacterized protein n=1 Tax=Bombyx mori TaxID=7091 RepID=A0A8R2HP43_BOMMO|nr:uncharacterized protein LOC110384868 [Bombyx mori]